MVHTPRNVAQCTRKARSSHHIANHLQCRLKVHLGLGQLGARLKFVGAVADAQARRPNALGKVRAEVVAKDVDNASR